MVKSLENVSYGREGLAGYATIAAESRGRLHDESPSPTRTAFQRDRDRIIHSTAFRRLKHKTQVFVHHVGDHYRTRLTHSIEVAQIARSLARALRADEDLAEALALSHDFGHTPFGHAGEDALNAVMHDYGGFDHNAHSLRIVTSLEQQYAEFDGLNLSWETLEGLVKHNGPVLSPEVPLDAVPQTILEFNDLFDLELDTRSGVEAQCAAIADDIAYNAHDLDDGLRAGLFSLADLVDLPIASDTLLRVERKYPGLDPHRIAHEIVRHQITVMVEDAIIEAQTRLNQLKPQSAAEVRTASNPVVAFSRQMADHEKSIKSFLVQHMYRAPQVMQMRNNATKIIHDLFGAYISGQAQLPPERVLVTAGNANDQESPRKIADFIAGMTDRYAIQEHQRLFDLTPDLG